MYWVSSLILVMASTLTEALELKRAGFVGMRGKKSDSIEVPTDDFYENNPKMLYQSKRQGKKYDDKMTTYLLFFTPFSLFIFWTFWIGPKCEREKLKIKVINKNPKKKFNNIYLIIISGFVGMRGKKSMDHEDAVNELFAAQNGADAERYLKRAGMYIRILFI